VRIQQLNVDVVQPSRKQLPVRRDGNSIYSFFALDHTRASH
jgi:hypothetical protein